MSFALSERARSAEAEAAFRLRGLKSIAQMSFLNTAMTPERAME
jgi:hypothetical protein